MSLWGLIVNLVRGNKVQVYVTMRDANYSRVAEQLEKTGIPFYVKTGGNMAEANLDTITGCRNTKFM